VFGKIKDEFIRIQSWGRQDFVPLIIKQGELITMNRFLLIKDVLE
jgi:hypothetical protein